MPSDLLGQLDRLKPGDHVCPIHEDGPRELGIVVDFIQQGLASEQRCLSVAEEPMLAELADRCTVAGIDLHREIERGALQLLTPNTCLRSGDGHPRRMIDYLERAEQAAAADGFRGLRFTGDLTGGAGTSPDPDWLIEYEVLLNQHLEQGTSIVLCHHRQARLDAGMMHDVVRTHPLVILDDAVCPNPYYEHPKVRGEQVAISEFKQSRRNWWISRLRRALHRNQEQQQTARMLRECEEQMQLLLEATREGIYGVDRKGRCTFANRACARLLGYATPEELSGKPMHDLLHAWPEEDWASPHEITRGPAPLHPGEVLHVAEDVLSRADGTWFDAECWFYPLRRGGELLGGIGTFVDIGQRKALELQLQQAQKMEAMAQLAGGIAHDFNNLVTVIICYSDLLLRSNEAEAGSRELLEEIHRAGLQAADLTRQLLGFSRKQAHVPRILDLNDVIREAAKLLQSVVGEDVRLTLALHENLGTVRADPQQLAQVLLNLAMNARDAMPQGGSLIIATENAELSAEHCRTHAGAHPGPCVRLSVSDTGTGMPEELRRRIFEPFFTTKAPGKGTGLGLAMVRGIIHGCGGYIDVESAIGQGTTFHMHLPRVDQFAESAAAVLDATPAAGCGDETILLVEDEEAVRLATRRILQDGGYTVLTAANAEAAQREAENHPGEIHLLLTDVVLPGEGGRMLADRLQAVRPQLEVLYMSGHAEHVIQEHGVRADQMPLIPKPFSPATLTRAVQQILARSVSS